MKSRNKNTNCKISFHFCVLPTSKVTYLLGCWALGTYVRARFSAIGFFFLPFSVPDFFFPPSLCSLFRLFFKFHVRVFFFSLSLYSLLCICCCCCFSSSVFTMAFINSKWRKCSHAMWQSVAKQKNQAANA